MFAYDAQPVLLKHALKEKHHRDPKRSVPQLLMAQKNNVCGWSECELYCGQASGRAVT